MPGMAIGIKGIKLFQRMQAPYRKLATPVSKPKERYSLG